MFPFILRPFLVPSSYGALAVFYFGLSFVYDIFIGSDFELSPNLFGFLFSLDSDSNVLSSVEKEAFWAFIVDLTAFQ
ncbi:hypothetical protein GDO86_008701 [Hymenochirus boettgeri]|uniref:Uncharacterized protein n=1 Tax=Hymenochirus boettgeri TaxID=247094 RepID=A0A8T2IYK1_9PIPI|nr:hypothetical protein GDO86_008701 [Hymenochirus boettgeri]